MWKWIKDWEVREWLTLFFASSAALVPWLVYRHGVRQTAKAASANWSIAVVPHMHVEGFLWAEIRLEHPSENRFHLIALTAKRPMGLLLTGWANEGGADPKYVPKPATPVNTLAMSRNLDAYRTYGAYSTVYDYSKLSFLIKMPSRPWYARSERTRAEIIAIVEEISSERRLSRIAIRTPPIEWTASKNASTT